MRMLAALSLSAPLLLIALVVGAWTTTPANLAEASAAEAAASRASEVVRLDVKVLEATPRALVDAGVRLSSIGADATTTEAALALVRGDEPAGGTRMIADLAYTIAKGRRTTFSTSLRMPTTVTTVAGTGATTIGFGGYETSDVSMAFDATRYDAGILAVDYRVNALRGKAQPGIPAPKIDRTGGFALAIEPGRTHVVGGMVHGEDEASYLLFFVEVRPVD